MGKLVKEGIFEFIANDISKEMIGGVEKISDYGTKCVKEGFDSGMNFVYGILHKLELTRGFQSTYTPEELTNLIKNQYNIYTKDG